MKKSIIWGMLGLAAMSGNAAAIMIDTTTDSTLLTDTIVGSNITVDYSSINYVGSTNQAAIFTDGFSSGLAIDQGIMLTTGDASLAAGPNSRQDSGANLGTDGDTTMSDLVGGLDTFDANILEFEFTTSTGDLFFDFIFASEEYNEYLEYNDPFALLLTMSTMPWRLTVK